MYNKENHPIIAKDILLYAQFLLSIKKYEAAENESRKAMAICEEIYGKESIEIADYYKNISNILKVNTYIYIYKRECVYNELILLI